MKTERKIILLFIAFGVLVWVIDTLFDYFIFYTGQGTFLDILLFNIPPHELYVRLSALVLLTALGIVFAYYITELQLSRTRLQNIFNNVIPICITNSNYEIIGTNQSYDSIFGGGKKDSPLVKCYDERPGSKCKKDGCPLVEILSKGQKYYTCETVKVNQDGTDRHFIVAATPLKDFEGNITGIIETFQDITPRKALEKDKERLIDDLKEALAQVKLLSGFLPICASCKKIRDDKGYWTQIETYIRNHSEAEFSHGICPDCAEKHYGFKKENT